MESLTDASLKICKTFIASYLHIPKNLIYNLHMFQKDFSVSSKILLFELKRFQFYNKN